LGQRRPELADELYRTWLEVEQRGSVLDPAKLAQSLHKGGDPNALCRRYGATHEPDGRQLSRLLRARSYWPRQIFVVLCAM
jgi:hypothetical protein